MGISSVGVGSSILTQDVLDQLRAADEGGQITPITLSLANEGDKKDALALIDASMTNLIDSINEIKSQSLYDERKTTLTGSSVAVTAAANSDIQDFTLNVTTLATKQIEQSGSFGSEDDLVSGGAGQINLNIDGQDFAIDYTATTTLKELKNLINDVAGDKVDATVVQIGASDFRLFISSADTGTTQNITITDVTGTIDSKLSTDFDAVAIQSGVNAAFTFNGQAISRTSNQVDDLITGLKITLQATGSTDVSVQQDRENILSKFDSFVEKYNATITELDKMTKPSTDSDERGIFSGESTIKNMKRAIEDMIGSIGGGVGSLLDYGFDVDKSGTMTLDKTVLETKMDENSSNVEIFFAGGDFDNGDGTTTTVDGAFTEFSAKVEEYTKYNATLDQFKDSISETISSLEDRKAKATERLDAKYEILKKQFIAYDLMISRINSASSMFVQMANAQTAAQNS
ncbi:flagellar hook-associated protein FliD [Sulfurimonas gotlandica GD1]|uniref:Flagellar hook-associated protein 2 n=1 Tax=Sulfurimonas gotlandica (strain DSM 19862 / JCM 16533 / GD1) TaxID=929558 RepID=B6BGD3_SULGG|nr:flagellar filament capping protein FliD [Sulfurimonas gotlandica]EDZ63526.1 flagellar hook-associated protein 2, putative [Sulfurimonas gotlandica GD1]EHP29560.1 flagellar hook-associated protein FliD [Sulfurimonas gotlandica GD1]